MKQPTFIELWALYQKRIKEGKVAAEVLLEIWQKGYADCFADEKAKVAAKIY